MERILARAPARRPGARPRRRGGVRRAGRGPADLRGQRPAQGPGRARRDRAADARRRQRPLRRRAQRDARACCPRAGPARRRTTRATTSCCSPSSPTSPTSGAAPTSPAPSRSATPTARELVVEGRMHGRVIRETRGSGGFGYDVVFAADEHPGADHRRAVGRPTRTRSPTAAGRCARSRLRWRRLVRRDPAADERAPQRGQHEHQDRVDRRRDRDLGAVEHLHGDEDRQRAVVDADLHRRGDRLVLDDAERPRDDVPDHQADRAEQRGDQADVGEVVADVLALVEQDAEHQDRQDHRRADPHRPVHPPGERRAAGAHEHADADRHQDQHEDLDAPRRAASRPSRPGRSSRSPGW